MPIKFNCGCGRAMSVKDDLGGKLVKCPTCTTKVRVPLASETKARIEIDAPSEELDLPPDLAQVGRRSESSMGNKAWAGSSSGAGKAAKKKSEDSTEAKSSKSSEATGAAEGACPECGAKVTAEDALCTTCGHELKAQVPEDPKKKLIVIGGAAGAAVLLIVLVVVFATGGPSGEDSYLEGVELQKKKQFSEAKKALAAAVEADGSESKYHLALAQVLLALQDHAQAVKAAEKGLKALKDGEDGGSLHLIVGQSQLNLGKADKAVTALDKARQSAGVDKDLATRLLGDALRMNGDVDGAIAKYEQAASNPDQKAACEFGMGMAYLLAEENAEAKTWLLRCVASDDSHGAAYEQLARLALAESAYGEAADFASKAAANSPESPELFLIQGRALFGQGKLDAARSALEKGRAIAEENVEILGLLVKVYMGLGAKTASYYDTALETCDKALAIKANEELHLDRGRILLAQNKTEEAIKSLDASGLIEGRVEMGKIYYQQGKRKEAKEHLEYAIKKSPALVSPRLVLSKIYSAEKDYGSAVRVLSEVEKGDDSDSIELLNSLAEAHSLSGSWSRALSCLERLKARDPKNPVALFSLGKCLFELKRYDDCIATLDELLALDAGHTEAQKLKSQAQLAKFE